MRQCRAATAGPAQHRLVSVDVVHLGESPGRIDEAERLGVHSVPAMVLTDQSEPSVLHINHGADLADLKA